LYGGEVLRAYVLLSLVVLTMLVSACTRGASDAKGPSLPSSAGVAPTRAPSALDIPPGAEVLFFVTAFDVDYGATDRAQYIKDFKAPAGAIDLDVKCLDPDGAPLAVKVSARPGDRQAELVMPSCTLDKGHQRGTYDLGPPYEGSRWIAEINARRRTRFQVLITQPAPTPVPPVSR
jgi:hypothetical protein